MPITGKHVPQTVVFLFDYNITFEEKIRSQLRGNGDVILKSSNLTCNSFKYIQIIVVLWYKE